MLNSVLTVERDAPGLIRARVGSPLPMQPFRSSIDDRCPWCFSYGGHRLNVRGRQLIVAAIACWLRRILHHYLLTGGF